MQMVNPTPAFADPPHAPNRFTPGVSESGVRPYIRLDPLMSALTPQGRRADLPDGR